MLIHAALVARWCLFVFMPFFWPFESFWFIANYLLILPLIDFFGNLFMFMICGTYCLDKEGDKKDGIMKLPNGSKILTSLLVNLFVTFICYYNWTGSEIWIPSLLHLGINLLEQTDCVTTYYQKKIDWYF